MKIKEIEIHADDLIATEAFYTGVLGLKINLKASNKISFAAGETILNFVKSDTEKPVYHLAFNIPANQLETAFQWMTTKIETIPVSATENYAHFDSWNAEAFYFLDNNQNLLEFIARKDLENAVDENFNSNHILSISEIGIVVDNVKEACEKLMKQTGLNYFSKQPPMDSFAALGDDNGLLILVNKGRCWYPTNIVSNNFSLKVKIEENESNFELEF